jgi:hypothetical protein
MQHRSVSTATLMDRTKISSRRVRSSETTASLAVAEAAAGLRVTPAWNARSHADRRDRGCPYAGAMEHSGAADGSASSTVSQVHAGCKQKSSTVGRLDETRCWCNPAGAGGQFSAGESSGSERARPSRLRERPFCIVASRGFSGLLLLSLAPVRSGSHQRLLRRLARGRSFVKPEVSGGPHDGSDLFRSESLPAMASATRSLGVG